MVKITVKFQMPSNSDADRYGIALATTKAQAVINANAQTFAVRRTGATPSEIVTADVFELHDGTDLVDKMVYYLVVCSGDSSNNWRTDYSESDVVTVTAEWVYSSPKVETTLGQPWERICRDDPKNFDDYFGMNMAQSSAEVLVHDCEAGEYIGIYGHKCVVYPVSEYDLDRDAIFGEDVLKKYSTGTEIKFIWEPTQEVQLFGRFDIQNIDEIILYNHISSTQCLLGRNLRVGDWIMTPHNRVIYEVVLVKNTNYLFHLGQFFSTVTALPRIVSQERGVGDTDSHAPEPTSGYFHTEGDKTDVDDYVEDVVVTDDDEEDRKDLFGGW